MLAQELKSSTQELHNSLESGPFQNKLANADLTIDHYAGYLSQLYLIHQQLETSLSKCEGFPEWHRETPYLIEDLGTLGVDANNILPLPATAQLVKNIQAAKLPALLGYYYVLFGSKHGGKYMAASYRKRGVACKYFDPYGADFSQMWKRFIDALNTETLSEKEKELAIQAAKDMFMTIGQVCEQLA
jgi:heme oxygenase